MNSFEQELIFDCLDLHQGNEFIYEQVQSYDVGYGQPLDQFQRNQRMDQYLREREKVDKLDPTGLDIIPPDNPYPSSQPSHHQDTQINSTAHCSQPHGDILVQPQTQLRRISCMKGESYQTQNIGKHLKSITMSYLLLLKQARILELEELDLTNIFSCSNGSIRDFEELFQLPSLSTKCLEFYSSTGFMTGVLTSQKMDMHSKLMMIKYAQKLRSVAYTKITGWKLLPN